MFCPTSVSHSKHATFFHTIFTCENVYKIIRVETERIRLQKNVTQYKIRGEIVFDAMSVCVLSFFKQIICLLPGLRAYQYRMVWLSCSRRLLCVRVYISSYCMFKLRNSKEDISVLSTDLLFGFGIFLLF